MTSQANANSYDLAVVGAGAAGQLAAIAAAEEGRRVVLLEQMPRAGLKVLASGGGRCNLTNLCEPSAMVAAFGRQGRFMRPSLAAMGPTALRGLMERLGVPTVAEGPRVYPASGRAADVQAALARGLSALGVELRHRRAVSQLLLDAGRLAGVEAVGGRRIAAKRVVLACGGRSWPKLGGTGGGYVLAEQAGHTIVEPLAALAPLVTREDWPARLAGVGLSGARIWIARRGRSKAGVTGDVLLTHRGLSGPAVLDISGDVAEAIGRHGPTPVRIELLAGVDAPAWRRRLEDWRGASGHRQVKPLLGKHVPASLAGVLCELAGVDGRTTAAQLPAAGRDRLAELLGGLELTVTATEGFDVAFVTRGGVRLREVDPATLASRLLPGLHLAGEMLDLDGPSGGFNLQWAFASGWLAGKAAARPAD